MLPVIRKINLEPWNGSPRHWGQLERIWDDIAENEFELLNNTGSLDIYEDDQKLHIEVELPGFKRKEISITLEDGILHLLAERKTESAKDANYYMRQRRQEKFTRNIELPVVVDAEKVEAVLEDGILKVSLEKSAKSKPHKIEVN